MTQREKLIEKIRNNPTSIRFEDLEKILNWLGYIAKQPNSGSSHYTFRKKGCEAITIPKKKPVKRIYVENVLEVLDKGE